MFLLFNIFKSNINYRLQQEHSTDNPVPSIGKGKVALHAMNAREGVVVQLRSFLTSIPDGGQWPVSRTRRLNTGGKHPRAHSVWTRVGARAESNNIAPLA
jgi:hypothetical protein